MTVQFPSQPESGSNDDPLEAITADDTGNADRFRRMKQEKWGGEVLGG